MCSRARCCRINKHRHTKNIVNHVHTFQGLWLWIAHHWHVLHNIARWLSLRSLEIAHYQNHIIKLWWTSILQAILLACHRHTLARPSGNHQVHMAITMDILCRNQNNISSKRREGSLDGTCSQQFRELSPQSPWMSLGHLSSRFIHINIDVALDLESCLQNRYQATANPFK